MMANHIEIAREDLISDYRGRANPNPPRPQPKNRGSHGMALKAELTQVIQEIGEKRTIAGIQSDNLLVLELLSDAMSPDILDRMLNKFSLYLVEENKIPQTYNTRLLIQFEDKAALDSFDYERSLWESDDPSVALLTYAQRRDLFDCIESIRRVSREDRIGQRLQKSFESGNLPTGFFIVNFDIWYSGDRTQINQIESQIRTALGTQGSTLVGDLFELPSLLLGRARVNEFTLNVLLDMDIVAIVDLPLGAVSPEPYELYTEDFDPIIEDTLDENAPLATVIDTGVFSANSLLSNIIVGEEDFDQTENTTSDLHGHGTGVAGIVAFGDFDEALSSRYFRPLVRICNGKVMHNEHDCPVFAEEKRPEQIVKEAIEFFNREYGCRVFNLSAGDCDHIYGGGRQLAWAEVLDQVSRELDVIIVVSAGNVVYPNIPDFTSREDFIEKCRDQLFLEEHRLIDPATAALSITVGSITRFAEPDNSRAGIARVSAGDKDYMSVYTRIGLGVNGAIKPEFVDYGGNYALTQITRGNNRWFERDMKLLEPTLSNRHDRLFKGWCGTSFAAPHVTHIAARIERALENQIEAPPSANLIKAVLASSARCSQRMREWTENSTDPLCINEKIPKQQQRLRLVGYGKVDDSVLYSGTQQVTMFSEDVLDLKTFHLYKIPVPKEFVELRANKRIAIGMAYNPPTRLSRKEYIANSMWFEVFRRIDQDTLLLYKAKMETGGDAEDIINKMPNNFKGPFSPGYQELQNSTLQQRVWEKKERGGSDLLWDVNEPYIYILVSGKAKFKHPDMQLPQQYALAITFSYDAEDDIELYQKLQNRVKIKERVTIRPRTQIQI